MFSPNNTSLKNFGLFQTTLHGSTRTQESNLANCNSINHKSLVILAIHFYGDGSFESRTKTLLAKKKVDSLPC